MLSSVNSSKYSSELEELQKCIISALHLKSKPLHLDLDYVILCKPEVVESRLADISYYEETEECIRIQISSMYWGNPGLKEFFKYIPCYGSKYAWSEGKDATSAYITISRFREFSVPFMLRVFMSSEAHNIAIQALGLNKRQTSCNKDNRDAFANLLKSVGQLVNAPIAEIIIMPYFNDGSKSARKLFLRKNSKDEYVVLLV